MWSPNQRLRPRPHNSRLFPPIPGNANGRGRLNPRGECRMTSDKFEFGRVRVADIFVGERQRKDLGDLTNLAGSFGDLGQAAEAYLRKFAANLRPRLRSREFD